MGYGFFSLIAIAGLLLVFLAPHSAYSDFSANSKYLIQATGFVSGTQDVMDSSIDIQLTAGTQSGTSILSTLDTGLVTINGVNYLNTGGWTTTLLRDGKYLLLQGNAQDTQGNTIQLNLFGRQINSTPNGIVYSIGGKITGTETYRVIYSAKVLAAGQPTTVTTPTSSQTPSQGQNASNIMRISIVAGASNKFNQIFFSPSITSVPPGTTIIWTNDDSVPHRIMSGAASAIRGNDSLPTFAPDGMIDSGIIEPGKSFQYVITNFNPRAFLSQAAAQYMNLPVDQTAGDITFFDPSYTWMVGVISPASATTEAKSVQINILPGASTASGTNNQFLSPAYVQVTSGTTIVWINHDSVAHRILTGQTTQNTAAIRGGSFLTPSFVPDGKIDSGTIAPGQSFQYTITGTGTFSYYDYSNTWLNGGIVVVSQVSQNPPVQITIVQGASSSQGSASQQNQYYTNNYFLPDQVSIVPGTTVIWVNNDNIAHSIYSGTATYSTTNPFIPDGKIKSGMIPPGQTFQVIINETGIIRFYDPSYTWMNGLIISIPSSQTHVTTNNPTSGSITPILR
ncbi:MAG TPA: hypothetical protein VJ792_03365 [Candidatus Nitrosotalea sp.]|nr:hypothetical protein [Candidatus Nitrosotalea sp.]